MNELQIDISTVNTSVLSVLEMVQDTSEGTPPLSHKLTLTHPRGLNESQEGASRPLTHPSSSSA
jgi:hypothetical protein